jgi:hypothetical protein
MHLRQHECQHQLQNVSGLVQDPLLPQDPDPIIFANDKYLVIIKMIAEN